jgi:hypothetical protein
VYKDDDDDNDNNNNNNNKNNNEAIRDEIPFPTSSAALWCS